MATPIKDDGVMWDRPIHGGGNQWDKMPGVGSKQGG